MRYIFFFFLFSIIYSNNVEISGFVRDSKNQKPLAGANVFFIGSSIGTSTDAKGFYKLSNIKI